MQLSLKFFLSLIERGGAEKTYQECFVASVAEIRDRVPSFSLGKWIL